MKKQLFISTSNSDYSIIKQLVIQTSLLKKVDFLILFKLSKDEISQLNKYNINLHIYDQKLTNKYNDPNQIRLEISRLTNFYSRFIVEKKYDQIIVLGDRYELLPIVQISYLFKKIIIHLHGGEITEGSWDDSIRHSISKLSHIHFVTSKKAKQNLINMGESRKNIYNFGSIGAHNAHDVSLLSKSEIFKKLDIKTDTKTCLIVIQPITNREIDYKKIVDDILNFLKHNNFKQLLISSINSDPGSKELVSLIDKNYSFATKHLKSLGLVNYLSLAKHSDLVIGNSSSFIFELPMKNIKSIMLTNRQDGRHLPSQVFKSESNLNDLNKAYKNLIKSKTTINSLYYKSNTPDKIANKIYNFSKESPDYSKVLKIEK